MYKLFLYNQILTPDSLSYQLYINMYNDIDQHIMFCDKNIVANPLFSIMHTTNLLGKNYLILGDNSIYNICKTYSSCDFIIIDNPKPFNESNVKHIDKLGMVDNPNAINTLIRILDNEYKKYKV